MLSKIFSAIKNIGNFFTTVFDVVVDFLKGIANFVANITKIPSLMSSLFSGGMLPSVLVGGIAAVIATIIILRVIGRD